MKEKYIILRSVGEPDDGISLKSFALPNNESSEPIGVILEVEEVDSHFVERVSSHNDVIAVAPSIPMTLVEPIDIPDQVPSSDQSMSWGINAVGADSSPYTGNGIIVAVLDSGIDKSHIAFTGVDIIEKDFTGTGNGDEHGHGTHCAGTIFGRDCEGKRIGVARGVKKALIGKVIDKNHGSSDSTIRGINWAFENGANVISMSLGIDFTRYQKELHQKGFPIEIATSRALEGYRENIQLFERYAAYIRSQGAFWQTTVLIAAAGNESRRDIDPRFKIAVCPPAVSDGFISVAAIEKSPKGYQIASFSNTGAHVSAPGVRILSAKLGGGLSTMSGTSMATPHAVGVTVLWAEKLIQTGALRHYELTSRLIGLCSIESFTPGSDHNDIGAGIVRAPQ